jgi:integrase
MRPAGSAAASKPNLRAWPACAWCPCATGSARRSPASWPVVPASRTWSSQGPGGSNGIPRGARAPLSTTNLRRVYKAAVEAAGAELAHLDLRGPHDLRHTFATWLEDAAIPSRVIDELMGHASGRPDHAAGGSPMGRIYRETTPAMVARVTAALDDRIGRAQAGCCVSAARGPGLAGGRRSGGPLTWGGAEGI